MIPIRDYIPTRRPPVMTTTLITINILVFLFQFSLMTFGSLEPFIYSFGIVPYRLIHYFDLNAALTLVTSLFLHGGLLHIGSNLLYLWIFGNNIEDAMGPWRFMVFYLVCGILAGLAEVVATPNSTIPAIGASGAIAGVLGAYFVLYPTARVDTLLIVGFFAVVRALPAAVVLFFWFFLQLLNGVASFGISRTGGIAWFAHIGGFISGLVLVHLFVHPPRRRRFQPRY